MVHMCSICVNLTALFVICDVGQKKQQAEGCFSLTVPNFEGFFRLLYRTFNEDSKNVLKIVIFLLQVGFTVDFVPDCLFKL